MKRVAFTIVLNGMPFIAELGKLIPSCFDKWYIVEGACIPNHDTMWCKEIPSKFYGKDFLSIDGTKELLDNIRSDKVSVIRKDRLWDGKIEMCNSFMDEVENSILMQFDSDEIWDKKTLEDVLEFSESKDGFDSIYFKCNYFVGHNIKICSEGMYGDKWYEWARLWKIKNRTKWLSHEPPRLEGISNPLGKEFSSSMGWTFNHYAYLTRKQVEFKEAFYGYKGAVSKWESLQNNKNFPCYIRDYFDWVKDKAMVEKIK